jgi:hypothetical protein
MGIGNQGKITIVGRVESTPIEPLAMLKSIQAELFKALVFSSG